MLKRLIIYAFLLVPVWGTAQTYQLLPNFYRPIDSAAIAQNQSKDKTDFGVTVGTGFSSMGGGMMQSYVAPHFSYMVNDNLQLSFSGVIMNANSSLINGTPSIMPHSSGANSYAFSAGTTYQPTDKLTIRSHGTYMENSMQPYNLFPQQQGNMDYKSLSFGVGYQFNEKTHIGFEFRVSQGYNPYYSPYHNNFHTNPYRFDTPFGW